MAARCAQVTFFAGIMTLDARRQAARRFDVIACFKDTKPVNSGACCGACGAGRPRKRVSTRAMEGLAKLLSYKAVKVRRSGSCCVMGARIEGDGWEQRLNL